MSLPPPKLRTSRLTIIIIVILITSQSEARQPLFGPALEADSAVQTGNSRGHNLQKHTVLAATPTFAAAGALGVVAVASTVFVVVVVAAAAAVAAAEEPAVEELVVAGLGSESVASLEADPVEDMAGFARQ
jgi:hypothetical protein